MNNIRQTKKRIFLFTFFILLMLCSIGDLLNAQALDNDSIFGYANTMLEADDEIIAISPAGPEADALFRYLRQGTVPDDRPDKDMRVVGMVLCRAHNPISSAQHMLLRGRGTVALGEIMASVIASDYRILLKRLAEDEIDVDGVVGQVAASAVINNQRNELEISVKAKNTVTGQSNYLLVRFISALKPTEDELKKLVDEVTSNNKRTVTPVVVKNSTVDDPLEFSQRVDSIFEADRDYQAIKERFNSYREP